MKISNQSKTNNGVFTIPNALSLFRIFLIPAMIGEYRRGRYENMVLLLILSGLTDVADGFVARRFGMISDVGKVLDPVADKLTQATVLLCLIFRYKLMILPLGLMVIKEIFMAATGLMIIRKSGVVCGAEWHGKLATSLLYAMMALHIYWQNITPQVSGATIFACSARICLSFFMYGRRNIKILQDCKAQAGGIGVSQQ